MSRPRCRWVAAGAERVLLADLLARLDPNGVEALADGRVFIDGRRAGDGNVTVAAGSVVELYPRRAASEGVEVLARERGLVFAFKPAGVATEPDHAGVTDSLLAHVERLLEAPRGSLHALSRLDVGVSGVVTLALDAAGRALAEELRARGRFERRYLALAGGVPDPERGVWSQPIGRRRDGKRMPGGTDAKPASSRYLTIARTELAALLALSPETGRTHQLRVHAAAAGAPLLGDRGYGGVSRLKLASGRVLGVSRPALHALWVELGLPEGPLRVEAPVPEDFSGLWSELGGGQAELERAGDAILATIPGRGGLS